VPAEPKPETTQRASAVTLVDRTPDRHVPPAAGHRLAPNGGEGHRARCEPSTGNRCQLSSAQHVAEIETDSGTADPAGTPEVCAKTGESQTEIPAGLPGVRYLSPLEAARAIPGCPSDESVYRWIKRGILHHGRRVKLRAVRVGGRWYTTRADLHVFLTKINPGLRGSQAGVDVAVYGAASSVPPACNPREAKRRHERTMERLRAMGLA
jgi:hypothetical protein